MTNNNVINKLFEVSKKPKLFESGDGDIWREEYIAKQMLKSHLDKNVDGASKNKKAIDKIVDFINSNIQNNSTVLDLGCGPGLYAEELCKRGHRVTGIDFSENSIMYAEKNAEKQGLNIEYRCADMFDIDYTEEYDVIIQIYGEINTFSDTQRDRIMSIAKNALKDGGLFIFEITTPVCRSKKSLSKAWYTGENDFWREGKHIVLQEGFKYDNNIYLEQYIVIDNMDTNVYRNWFHDYTAGDITKIILESGFKDVKIIEGLTGEYVGDEPEWLTVIALK